MPFVGERGSGNIVERDFDLRDFDSVQAGHAFSVTLEQGDEFAVTVAADDNVMSEVIVEVVNGELRLGLPEGRIYFNRTLRAHVTMPELVELAASGASNITMNGFPSVDEFAVTVSGASTVVGSVEADDLSVNISGAGKLELSGSAETLQAVISGASHLRAGELTTETARITASGASSVDVIVTEALDVVASGASTVNYSGGGALRTSNSSGASSINER